MLTRDEFIARFRGPMLVYLAECWAIRKEHPSAVGFVMDDHHRKLNNLMHEMYAALSPLPDAKAKEPSTNGVMPNGVHPETGTEGAAGGKPNNDPLPTRPARTAFR